MRQGARDHSRRRLVQILGAQVSVFHFQLLSEFNTYLRSLGMSHAIRYLVQPVGWGGGMGVIRRWR